jgi:hypothetical protein
LPRSGTVGFFLAAASLPASTQAILACTNGSDLLSVSLATSSVANGETHQVVITLSLGTLSIYVDGTLEATASLTAFGVRLTRRLSFDTLPDQMWDDTGDYTVEGWTEALTATSWTLTANLLLWELAEVFILDDDTYGVLDSSPLGY